MGGNQQTCCWQCTPQTWNLAFCILAKSSSYVSGRARSAWGHSTCSPTSGQVEIKRRIAFGIESQPQLCLVHWRRKGKYFHSKSRGQTDPVFRKCRARRIGLRPRPHAVHSDKRHSEISRPVKWCTISCLHGRRRAGSTMFHLEAHPSNTTTTSAGFGTAISSHEQRIH